jgi:proline iminopeptidase
MSDRVYLATTSLLLFLCASLSLPYELHAAPSAPSVQYWDLPTGSKIAYLEFPAIGQRREYPIVFLHGGPGAYAVTIEATTQVLSELTADGFDVYVYDQIGGGLSERLSDITEYTVARHVADLEAIRQQLSAEKLILIGSSWGAQLAARYITRYPARVDRVILAGPGALHPPDWKQNGYGRIEARFTDEEMAQLQAMVNRPELERAVELLASDPAAAMRAFPDDAADGLFDEVTNRFYLPHLGCAGTRYTFTSRGYGFWANRMTGRDLDVSSSPLPALKESGVRALILRGECEYMKREVAEQYLDAFPGSTMADVPGAGHMLFWDRPRVFLDLVRKFVRN